MKQKVKSNRDYLVGDMRVGNKTVKITSSDGDVYEFSIEELTANNVKVPPAGKVLKGIKVVVSNDGNTLYGYGPATGSHLVRFSEFAHGRDKEPSPRMQAGGERQLKDGRKWYAPDKQVCTALLEVVSGDFEGCEIALQLDYCFDKDENGMTAMNGSTKALKRWDDLIRLSGGDLSQAAVPYSSNVLPEMQDLFGDEVFQVRMEDGYPADLSDLPAGLGVPKAKKAPAKKPAAAPAKKPATKRTEKQIQDELEGKGQPVKPPTKKAPAKSAAIDTSKAKPLAKPKAATPAPAAPAKPAAKAPAKAKATVRKAATDGDVDFPA